MEKSINGESKESQKGKTCRIEREREIMSRRDGERETEREREKNREKEREERDSESLDT